MKKIYTPKDEMELAIVKSILESADIPYSVTNEHFGSLYVGPAMDMLNSKPVMVPEEYFDDASSVLANFLENDEEVIFEDETSEYYGESIDKDWGILDTIADSFNSVFSGLFRRKR